VIEKDYDYFEQTEKDNLEKKKIKTRTW